MKMRQFLAFPYPEEVWLAPSRAAGVVRDGKDERTVLTEAVGCMLAGGRKGKMEILVELGGSDGRALGSGIQSAAI